MARRALALLAAVSAIAATRPHYGGTLRVEAREAIESADPPQIGSTLARLNGPFSMTEWVAGSQASYAANENADGGRPFLDGVEVRMGRPIVEQMVDLQLGKADVIEIEPGEIRRGGSVERKIWSSAPVRVLALAFGPRAADERVREALALAVDRAAIRNVLLQGQGEISGALLPQWLSGYAFLFAISQDAPRARALVSAAPVAARTLTFSVADPAYRRIADRISLDARDAGLTLARATGAGDVRLVEIRIASADPARALAAEAASLGLPLAATPRADSPDALYAAERALLEGFRVVPLFHLPEVYAASPRVKGGPGITPLGEWQFENLWLEGGRP